MRFGKNLRLVFVVLGFAATSCADDESGDGGDDDDSTPACSVASVACVDGCIPTECGAEISGCSGDPTCDAAKDDMVSCVCDAQRAGDSDAVGVCLANFTDTGGIRSTPFAYCATSSCSSPCGL